MKKNIFGFMLSAALVSCTTTGSAVKTNNQPDLAGTQWQMADDVRGPRPTINFEGDKINGNAGCNNYFGAFNYDTSVGGFSAGQLGSTRKMCSIMETEQNFLNLLPQVTKYRVNGNTLELYKDNLLLMKFNRR